jgi:hypothetical protein
VVGIPILHPRFEPPPGWSAETEPRHIALTAPGGAAMMFAFAVAARERGQPSPADWIERIFLTETRGGFVDLGHGPRTEVDGPHGLTGLAWEVIGGYGKPEDLVEKRTYVVLAAEDALYPFALIASVAIHAAVVETFWRAVMTLEPF